MSRYRYVTRINLFSGPPYRAHRYSVCRWCGEMLEAFEMHPPHWFELRLRWLCAFERKAASIVCSNEPPADGKRCPRCLRLLRKAGARDVALCPGTGCSYAVDGLTLWRMRHGNHLS